MRKLTPFGKEVYKKMIDQDMWVPDLAKKLGITEEYLWNVITGKRKAEKIKERILEVLEE